MLASFAISLTMHLVFAASNADRHTNNQRISGVSASSNALIARLSGNQSGIIRSTEPFGPVSKKKGVEVPAVTPKIDAPVPDEIAEAVPYASPETVDQMASVIIPPELPLPLDPNLAFGFMRIKIFVNEEGLAEYVELLESNFPEDYASTLVDQFKLAKFAPGISGGKAIKSWRIVEIDYSST